jgi:hypothetical protein
MSHPEFLDHMFERRKRVQKEKGLGKKDLLN